MSDVAVLYCTSLHSAVNSPSCCCLRLIDSVWRNLHYTKQREAVVCIILGVSACDVCVLKLGSRETTPEMRLSGINLGHYCLPILSAKRQSYGDWWSHTQSFHRSNEK